MKEKMEGEGGRKRRGSRIVSLHVCKLHEVKGYHEHCVYQCTILLHPGKWFRS